MIWLFRPTPFFGKWFQNRYLRKLRLIWHVTQFFLNLVFGYSCFNVNKFPKLCTDLPVEINFFLN